MSTLPTTSRAIVLQQAPEESVNLDYAENGTSALHSTPLEPVKEGELLVKIIYISNDPLQRLLINKNFDSSRFHRMRVKEGNVMFAYGLGIVLSSKADNIKEGQLVFGSELGWRDYAVVAADTTMPVKPIPGLLATLFLGALGAGGATAWFGLTDILKLQRGQSLIVNGAAGSIGLLVVQIAKHIIGASKVVAIAGSDAKCKYLKDVGADVALNYKSSTFKDDLTAATDGYVDAFFDNIGGENFDIAVTRVKQFGTVALCGATSLMAGSGAVLKNWILLITNRLTLRGFSAYNFMNRLEESTDVVAKGLKDGTIKLEQSEMVIETKFEDIPKTWVMLFDGRNTGKLITQIATI